MSEITNGTIIIGDVEKNKNQVVRVSISEYKGKKFIDARVYFKDKEDNLVPTKKGITFTKKTFQPVMSVLIDAYKKLEELTDDGAPEVDDIE